MEHNDVAGAHGNATIASCAMVKLALRDRLDPKASGAQAILGAIRRAAINGDQLIEDRALKRGDGSEDFLQQGTCVPGRHDERNAHSGMLPIAVEQCQCVLFTKVSLRPVACACDTPYPSYPNPGNGAKTHMAQVDRENGPKTTWCGHHRKPRIARYHEQF